VTFLPECLSLRLLAGPVQLAQAPPSALCRKISIKKIVIFNKEFSAFSGR
jgi:hypothetical protein